MVSSGAGALMVSLFMTPLDVVKIRLQVSIRIEKQWLVDDVKICIMPDACKISKFCKIYYVGIILSNYFNCRPRTESSLRNVSSTATASWIISVQGTTQILNLMATKISKKL